MTAKISLVILALSLLMCGCSTRDEVLRVTSPDGKVDAVLFETNCGAPCSFGYEIQLVERGSRHGEQVASLEGATRNDHAWGVNLKWLGADNLLVEYLGAEDAKLLKQTAHMQGMTLTSRYAVASKIR